MVLPLLCPVSIPPPRSDSRSSSLLLVQISVPFDDGSRAFDIDDCLSCVKKGPAEDDNDTLMAEVELETDVRYQTSSPENKFRCKLLPIAP